MKSIASVVLMTLVLTLGIIAQTPAPAQRGRGGGRGNQATGPQNLAWVDRTGKVLGTIGAPQAAILDPSISPDGKKVVVRGRDTQGETEHAYIHEGNTKHRLTTNEGSERHEIWSPKGDKVAFSMQVAGQGNVSNLFIRNADGSGSDEPLVVSEGMHKWSPTWSPDGKFIVYHTNELSTNARDIGFVELATHKTGFLVQTPAIEALPRFSTDGKFVAYQAQPDADGKWEVYVTTFPKSDAKWQVSTNGGQWPRWSTDEIFYWEDNTLMAAKFTAKGSSFTVSPPVKLFTGAQVGMGSGVIGGYNFFYDYRDGRFVVVQRPPAAAGQ
jgi:Tol biopolymer transport system component